MKNTDWKSIAELIGIAAIVGSLVFVGLQLQQTQAIAIANQYQERAALNIDYRLAQMQSDTALKIEGTLLKREFDEADGFSVLGEEMESYSLEEIGYFEAKTVMALISFDNSYFQYQSGFLTESTWRAYEDELASIARIDFFQWIWSERKYSYRREFRDLVDQLVEASNSSQ